MKKSKLLMPILGVTATLGAVVPTIVACNKGEEEDGIQVKATVTNEGSQYEEDDTVAMVGKMPNAKIGEDYSAKVVWTHVDDSQQPVNSSAIRSVSVTDKEGKEIPFEATAAQKDTKENKWFSTISIGKDNIPPKGEITVKVVVIRDTYIENHKQPSDFASATLIGVKQTEEKVEVKGLASSAYHPGFFDAEFGYSIGLGAYDAAMRAIDPSYSILNKTNFIIYIYNGGGVLSDRVDPSEWYDHKIGADDATTSETGNSSLRITIPGGVTQEMIDANTLIKGGFSVAGQVGRNMDGAEVCIFEESQLD